MDRAAEFHIVVIDPLNGFREAGYTSVIPPLKANMRNWLRRLDDVT